MKKLLGLTLLLYATSAFAQEGRSMETGLGYARFATTATALTLRSNPTAGVGLPREAKGALLCSTGSVNWRDDNVSPNGTDGMPLPSGACLSVPVTNSNFLSNFRFWIVSGELRVRYIR